MYVKQFYLTMSVASLAKIEYYVDIEAGIFSIMQCDKKYDRSDRSTTKQQKKS